jgi:hypothetical protein
VENITTVIKELKVHLTEGPKQTISMSNTDFGIIEHKKLVAKSRMTVVPAAEGAVIFEGEILFRAKRIKFENDLVSLYTPRLMEIVQRVNPSLRLVNSECHTWLRCESLYSKCDLKPDLFSAHYSLVEFLSAYENAPKCSVDRFFGKFTSWESRCSIHCIWEGKTTIDMEGFGEACKYLQIAGHNILNHNDVLPQLKGVLFDKTEFWMITSCGTDIESLVKCKWSQGGSENLLLKFLQFEDPWMDASDDLCQNYDVAIADPSQSADSAYLPSAFLGAGANGRVFKLKLKADQKQKSDAPNFATPHPVLKVVVGTRSKSVEVEYRKMLKLLKREVVAPIVFPIIDNSYSYGIINGVEYAGYLLECKGEKLERDKAHKHKTKLAEALFRLHKNDVIHGDPRIENALLLQGQVKWIDFRDSIEVIAMKQLQTDVTILYKSLGGNEELAADKILEYAKDIKIDTLLGIFNILDIKGGSESESL